MLLLCLVKPLGGAPMQMGGMGALPLQSNLGALSQGSLPQAPGPLGGSSFSGLGMLGSAGQQAPSAGGLGGGGLPMQGGLGSGLGAFPAATPGAMEAGPAGAGQMGLPTLNLLGNAMGGNAMGGGSACGTPQNIQQMQAQAVQAPTVDQLCPGKQRTATNIGEECWARVWAAGGCRPENVPKFEEWHQMQSLEILVGDVVQWANLPDDRHKQGCYGSNGAPQNEPAPPMPTRGGLAPANGGPLSGGPLGLGGMQGMAPPSSGPLSGGIQSPMALGGGLGGGMGLGAPAQDQGPPPEVAQKIMALLQSPEIGNLCPGSERSSTGVGADCWSRIWRQVGCLESTTPAYEEWHNSQSFEVLVADAAQWSALPSAMHRQTCYGGSAEL